MGYTHVLFNGKKIVLNQFKKYHVTGILYNGRRFKTMIYSDFFTANSINLFNGSVWGVNKKGKRTLLKRVYN